MTDSRPSPPPPRTMLSAPGAETVIDGRQYLYFAGTGYLGLQGHPALVRAAVEAVERFGVHSATSRSGCGTAPPMAQVERRAAELLACQDACYVGSGYVANFALTAALRDRVDAVLFDRWAHDSVREAVAGLAGPRHPAQAFRHRDVGHLAERLAALPKGARPLVATDGIFAVSGHLAPVGEYVRLLDNIPGAMLLVDDAHALAVLGEQGHGSLEAAGIALARANRSFDHTAEGTRLFVTATLSKAVGGQGGIVCGTRDFIDNVRTASGWYRGASAPANPVAAATAQGLELALADDALRKQLAARVRQLRAGLRKLGLDVEDSPSPVVGLQLESAKAMQDLRGRLLEEGIFIAYSRDYAGAGAVGMLRIAVFATHAPEMIDALVDALRRLL